MTMKLAGTITTIAGAVVFIASAAALPWLGGYGISSQTVWSLTTRWPAITTALAAIALLLAVLSFFVDSLLLTLGAVCISFYLWGQVFDVGGTYSIYKAGFWVATAATVVMSVGGVFSVVGAWRRGQHMVDSQSGAMSPSRIAQMAAGPVHTTPPAGWYPDPSGQARERYWEGTTWTAQVR